MLFAAWCFLLKSNKYLVGKVGGVRELAEQARRCYALARDIDVTLVSLVVMDWSKWLRE